MTDPQQDLFLFFDLGNVLAMFDHELIVANLEQLCDASSDSIREAVFQSDLLQKYELGETTTSEFYQQFCKATGCTASESEVVFAASDIFHINATIIPLVSQLKQAGYKMGVLSNTCEAHWEFLRERYFILDSFFDVHALSYQLNALKPDATIYKKAANLIDCPAEKIFFVDDRSEHIEAARDAGWNAHVYESTPVLYRQLAEFGVVCNY